MDVFGIQFSYSQPAFDGLGGVAGIVMLLAAALFCAAYLAGLFIRLRFAVQTERWREEKKRRLLRDLLEMKKVQDEFDDEIRREIGAMASPVVTENAIDAALARHEGLLGLSKDAIREASDVRSDVPVQTPIAS